MSGCSIENLVKSKYEMNQGPTKQTLNPKPASTAATDPIPVAQGSAPADMKLPNPKGPCSYMVNTWALM